MLERTAVAVFCLRVVSTNTWTKFSAKGVAGEGGQSAFTLPTLF